MNCPANEYSFGEDRNRGRGFTLIELVLVMTLLIMVLSVSYGLIIDCLEADRTIETLTTPEKVGEGILALMREDLSGTIWRHLGTRVFFVHDNGREEEARDEIRFLSTVEPTPTVDVEQLRTLTGVNYFLRQNDNNHEMVTYTLFRKEIIDFDEDSPLDSRGMNYEIYNKMAYLSVECYDGWSPDPMFEWDSERQIEWEETELEAMKDNEGIGRVSSGSRSTREAAPTAPGFTPQDSAMRDAPPPAAIPRAVHLAIGFYTGSGDRIERDIHGNPILRTFSTIVPILTSQRVPIDMDDDFGTDFDGRASDQEEGENGGSSKSSTAGAAGSDPKRPGRRSRSPGAGGGM